MARFHTLVGLGLASTMMITAPVFASTPAASTTTAAKPAAHTAATPAYRAATATAPKPGRIDAENTTFQATLSNGNRPDCLIRMRATRTSRPCKG